MKIVLIKNDKVQEVQEDIQRFEIEKEKVQGDKKILDLKLFETNENKMIYRGLKLDFFAVKDSEQVAVGDVLTEDKKEMFKQSTEEFRFEGRSESDRLREENEALRRAVQVSARKMIQKNELTQSEIEEMKGAFLFYKPNVTYKKGDIFQYNNQLFEVIEEHVSRSNWVPEITSSLYKNHTQ